MNESAQTLDTFITDWTETPEQNKKAFIELKEHLAAKDGVNFEFIPREGITYSLRAMHKDQKKKPLFVMVDVIEDTPRWLSVCFYNEMITDPDENGDFVPEGLLGNDAVCFDVEIYDDVLMQYIKIRLDEAWQSASGG